jgi:hypothetical protein
VADEVRNLAQRSAEAARDTSRLIEESVQNAEEGVLITENVAKTLEDILNATSKVNDLVQEISAAAEEETKGIEQINIAVSELDKVTQINASNSEESASAAEELSSEAVRLNSQADTLNTQAIDIRELVSNFKLSANTFQAAEKPEPLKQTEQEIRKRVPGEDRNRERNKALSVIRERKGGNGGKDASPESVIPLDDDDFGDF